MQYKSRKANYRPVYAKFYIDDNEAIKKDVGTVDYFMLSCNRRANASCILDYATIAESNSSDIAEVYKSYLLEKAINFDVDDPDSPKNIPVSFATFKRIYKR